MKLLRFLLIFFVIYLVRRFIHAYQTLKITQQAQAEELKKHQQPASKVVDAEYKVVDR